MPYVIVCITLLIILYNIYSNTTAQQLLATINYF